MSDLRNSLNNALDLFESLPENSRLRGPAKSLIRGIVNDIVGLKRSNWFNRQELTFLHQGLKLSAVKAVRERLNLSLLEAKHYVEDHGNHILNAVTSNPLP